MRLKSSKNGCKGSSFEREYHCYLLEARKKINDFFEVIGIIVVVMHIGNLLKIPERINKYKCVYVPLFQSIIHE